MDSMLSQRAYNGSKVLKFYLAFYQLSRLGYT
jgi:hypothetical protein